MPTAVSLSAASYERTRGGTSVNRPMALDHRLKPRPSSTLPVSIPRDVVSYSTSTSVVVTAIVIVFIVVSIIIVLPETENTPQE